jgi:hypothetical protein
VAEKYTSPNISDLGAPFILPHIIRCHWNPKGKPDAEKPPS